MSDEKISVVGNVTFDADNDPAVCETLCGLADVNRPERVRTTRRPMHRPDRGWQQPDGRCTSRAVGAGNLGACEGEAETVGKAPLMSLGLECGPRNTPPPRGRSTPAPRGAGGRWGFPGFPRIVGLIRHSEAVQPYRTGGTSARCSWRPIRRSATRRLRSGWWRGPQRRPCEHMEGRGPSLPAARRI